MPTPPYRKLGLAALCVSGLLAAACTTTDPYTGMPVRNNTGTGVLSGAAAGAALGYLTNTSDSEQGRRNALIGAGIGALAGGAVGNYMDRQQAELRRDLERNGVMIRRQGDNIVLVMPSDVTFASGQATIAPQFTTALDDLARTLNAYPSTVIDVVGHADSTGSDQLNQTLSEQRAQSVTGYLVMRGVNQSRVIASGMGERAPVASNDTTEGRAQNRRVEITLRPFTG